MPYGIYDLAANSGWVSVGVDHDTAAFAVNSIRQWWLSRRSGALSRGNPIADHRHLPQRRLGAAAATARGCGCGNANCRSWPTSSASTSWSATCRPAPASGTKSSTASSPSSARTGAPSHSSAIGSDQVRDRTDLGHHHQNRPHRALRTRHRPIPQRHCRLRCRDGRHQHQTCRVPRRVELHHLAKHHPPNRAFICDEPLVEQDGLTDDKLPIVQKYGGAVVSNLYEPDAAQRRELDRLRRSSFPRLP